MLQDVVELEITIVVAFGGDKRPRSGMMESSPKRAIKSILVKPDSKAKLPHVRLKYMLMPVNLSTCLVSATFASMWLQEQCRIV